MCDGQLSYATSLASDNRYVTYVIISSCMLLEKKFATTYPLDNVKRARNVSAACISWYINFPFQWYH